MKSLRRVFLVLAVAGVLASVIAFFVVDEKYAALRDAPRISYDTIPGFQKGLLVLIEPNKAMELIALAVRKRQPKVPAWLVERVVPYEVALHLGPDVVGGAINVDAFLNERRFGPRIVDEGSRHLSSARGLPITWSTSGLNRPERGRIVVQGTLPIPENVTANLVETWGERSALAPMPVEGNHFVEANFDNRDGSLFAVVASWMATQNEDLLDADHQPIAEFVKHIKMVHAYADMVDEGEMSVIINVECTENTGSLLLVGAASIVNQMFPTVQMHVEKRYGLTVTGAAKLSSRVVQGQYRISDLRKLVE